MRRLRVVDATTGEVLAERAELADTAWRRFRGLMGRRSLEFGEGLVLKPGGAIHMFFMRIPLDVLHVDGRGRVTHVLRGIKPWRMGPLFVGGTLAVELPVGVAERVQPGHEIEVRPARS